MKRLIVVLMVLMTVTRGALAEYYPTTDEWPIPEAIHTQADLVKYQGYRKGLLVGGLSVLAGSLVALKVSGIYAGKASRMQVYGPVIQVPVAGGGSMGFQTMIPGNVEQQGHYLSKRNAWKTVGMVGILAGLSMLSVALSLRF